ncbi:hypothetical protein HPB52_022709 [Rhipicephalus sanguineus]|uniref:Uncharacterized protein n=1 Tax=Rhipicephalus sanguineus TaxID=34632 RepID=A0A9D4Q479_RHISA|nr:hypothetical protein HPB52_022709 [Rhipicephalus sanguineus]
MASLPGSASNISNAEIAKSGVFTQHKTRDMDLDKLTAVAAQLGLSGAELREWIEREQVRQRDERAAEREEAKEAAERQQLADERQLQILQLKLKLQESA